MRPTATGYCPGCLHGVVTRILCEVVDELGIADDLTCILPVGCSTMGLRHFDFDLIVAAHGRAPAVATGAKRCAPDRYVLVYQGDGDLASIGLSEIIYAANRGENITVVFVNNCIYGMTGGQMAPTTLVDQVTTTTPRGRNSLTEGYPLKMCEIISQLESPKYIVRHSLDNAPNVLKAKKSIKESLQYQKKEGGFCFIELLSNCPTNWGMTPVESLRWMEEHSKKVFPEGIFRDKRDAGVKNGE